MANLQISQLTPKPSPVASTDQFGIDDISSDTWKITVANLQTYFNSLYLALAGGTMAGNLTLAGDPTTALMAATKQYVDSVATGLNVQPSCRVATTGALTVTYNNGSSGVGSTITNSGAQAAIAIDGITLAINNRVLVKNQSSTFQNGIYTVTNLGSGSTNWVLTRATDYDTAAQITPGDFVLILSGTANAQSQWVETATVVTVGTDPIVWDQFGADVNTVITGIQNQQYTYTVDTGAADAYVIAPSPAITSYVAGQRFDVLVSNSNTGSSTVAVSGLAAKNIKLEDGTNPLASNMRAGMIASIEFDGTNFQLLNPNIGTGASTGTGQVVRATSPTLITPNIGAALADSVKFSSGNGILDQNGNAIMVFLTAASAVNYIDVHNAATGNSVSLSADGADTNILFTLAAKGNLGVTIQGTAAGGDAQAGYVGEFVSSNIVSGSAVSLTSNVTANITSISLTAGDWDVWGWASSLPGAGTTSSSFFAAIATTSAAFPTSSPTVGSVCGLNNSPSNPDQSFAVAIAQVRLSLSVTTTVYLMANSVFGVSTQKAFGFIAARRAR